MEAFFPRIALIVVTIVLGVMFLTGIADPQKKSHNSLSATYQTNITAMDTSIKATVPTP